MNKDFLKKRVIIIGSGPCGLGAAYCLRRIGHKNWVVYEKESKMAGLSSTFRDEKGFSWDVGGHVMFSKNRRFNILVNRMMGKDFVTHERESWIWTKGNWIPYPFQNNIHHLPEQLRLECLQGLFLAQKKKKKAVNFRDWIHGVFGDGIARLFLKPYNSKVWAMPLEKMSYDWINERVSVIDAEKIRKNTAAKKDDLSWGPNNKFIFPLYGGTGGFFNKFEPYVKGNINYKKEVTAVNIDSRTVALSENRQDNYDFLINTSPLDALIGMIKSRKTRIAGFRQKAKDLNRNGIYVIGIGIKKRIEGTKCWVYFPDEDIPFYRMTYFSRYSPNNVPSGDTQNYSSLLCETAFSKYKPVDEKEVLDSTVCGLIKAGIISSKDTRLIVSKFLKKIDYAYPIPTLFRDESLRAIQIFLEKNGIYSRGRFGAWKYEIGNMDHAVMMGIEIVERLFSGNKERVWKL